MIIMVRYMGTNHHLCRGLFVIVAVILVSSFGGCARNATFVQAKSMFDQNRKAFESLVTTIELCGGAEEINADTDLNTVYSHCSKKNAAFSDDISRKLAALHVETATITWTAQNKLFAIVFILTSQGVAGHGSASAIVYYANLRGHPYPDEISPRPLTELPSH